MAKTRKRPKASVGVAEHGNSAVLITLAPDGAFLDRRRIDLTDGLPTHPYHHQGSWAVGRYKDSPWAKEVSLEEAIALVKRVRDAAARGACKHLAALAADAPMPIGSIAIRQCPPLPASIEGRIRDNRAQTVADTVMYRKAIASAAIARDWSITWYDRDDVFKEAANALDGKDINEILLEIGRKAGPPWQAKHKLAAAAAIAAMT